MGYFEDVQMILPRQNGKTDRLVMLLADLAYTHHMRKGNVHIRCVCLHEAARSRLVFRLLQELHSRGLEHETHHSGSIRIGSFTILLSTVDADCLETRGRPVAGVFYEAEAMAEIVWRMVESGAKGLLTAKGES